MVYKAYLFFATNLLGLVVAMRMLTQPSFDATMDELCPLFTIRNTDTTKLYAEIYDKKATTIKVLCTTFTVSTFSTKMH
jgi:hypothetical protein